MDERKTQSLLGPYRILDLTDEKGFICGETLGNLGADVIKIEKPGGDPARSIGPFYRDIPHPEKSLYWFATNLNKRGITLDIETEDGKAIFKRLVRSAHVVLESYPPGLMEGLGLSYGALCEVNPGIIVTSITPFGQTGPYSRFKGADIVLWAMSGELYASGDPDRPPTQVSAPHQAYFNGSLQAVQATLAALYHCEITGEGQHVDITIQQAVTHVAMKGIEDWYTGRVNVMRRGPFFSRPRPAPLGPLNLRVIWPCKDGHVCFRMAGGVDVASRTSLQNMTAVLVREGVAGFLEDYDWRQYDWQTIPQEEQERLEEPFLNYFVTKTKAELYDEAVKGGIILAPVGTVSDLLENPQLAAREYWEQVEHPELNDRITYPGAFARVNEAPIRIWRRAPLIGEHNEEIYGKELGISRAQLVLLKQASVI